jgi:hypothetical protein
MMLVKRMALAMPYGVSQEIEMPFICSPLIVSAILGAVK